LYDEPTGRIALYYGGADTVTAMAFCKAGEVIDWLKHNSEL
jgi:beta-1,4-mannooligosaccharide/beta-1,4-mannosyl-N-acetylglucosamine phosphorylase